MRGFIALIILLCSRASAQLTPEQKALDLHNGRGLLVGYNNNGAGGSVGSGFATGKFSEGTANVTLSMMVRRAPVESAYGPTVYVENVGVQPDVVVDYMTRDYLLNAGRTFLNQVIEILIKQVEK